MRQSLGRSIADGDLMICIRCGEVEVATDSVFVMGFDRDSELVTAIDASLRRHGIDGVNGLGQLCECCWD